MRRLMVLIGLSVGLALAAWGFVAPGWAEAGSVTIESHRSGGVRGWQGNPRQGSGHRDGGNRDWGNRDSGNRNWSHRGGDHGPSGHWRHGHHGSGRHGSHGGYQGWHHSYGWAPSYPPVWMPPQWVWNGWGWVLEPGYWR